MLALLKDCQEKAEAEGYKIIHGIPPDAKAVAEQNFFRGKISAWEDLLGLAEELKVWRKPTK